MAQSAADTTPPNLVTNTEHDPQVIAGYLAELDPALLLASLVHLTGDLSLLQHYSSAFRPIDVRTAKLAHDVDPAKAGELRAALAAELAKGEDPKLLVPDLSVFERIAEMVVGEDIDDEFLNLLQEQAGFVRSKRVIEPEVTPPSDFDVIVIGSGLVGIAAAVKLSEAGFNFTVFEARDEIGGTWSRNIYPGVAVDTPSHYYSLSFELNPNWTHYYPFGNQYLRYLKGVTEKYNVLDRIQLSTSVLSCVWNEDREKWVVTTTHDGVVSTHEASAVITALGFFSRPIKPSFPEQDTFGGIIMHSAEWRPEVDLTGKRVAVLGAGCTAVQIVANIVNKVEDLTVVCRQPHWIVPEPVGQEVSDAMRWALSSIPFFHQWFRLRTYWYASEKGFPMSRVDPEWAKDHLSASPANDVMLQICTSYLDEKFADQPELKAKLTPDFPPFGKRIIKDPGFYDALLRDDVHLVTSEIDHFRPTGFTTADGTDVDVDVVILATGFTLDWLCTVDIQGRDGVVLNEKWEPFPEAYLGVTTPEFPNFFMTSGPNSAILHGGGNNFAGETQVHYIIECLQLMLNKGVKTMEVSQRTTDEYNVWVEAEMATTVWQNGGSAHGYYRSGGRTIVGSPWRMVDYWNELRRPREENFLFDGVDASAAVNA
jgi:cation diffusion facilitator CzcD-associated flavoprotein CzcO